MFCHPVLAIALAALLSAPPKLPAQSDQHLTRAVRQAIEREPRLRDHDIQISTLAGVVTLRGKVESYVDKSALEERTHRISGVRGVSNLIQVCPTLRQDLKLAGEIHRRLDSQGQFRPGSIAIQSNNGVVTLTGRVSSWAQIRQAQEITSQVLGVTRVHNDLQLLQPPQRP